VRLGTPLRFALAFVVLSCVRNVFGDEAPHVPDLPQVPDRVFKITDYSAVEGDAGDNTKAIQGAIDAATAAGGGTVEVPSGRFLCGPIHLTNQINLHLATGATLVMLPIDKYPGGTESPESFISGQGLHDVEISGEGTIDGQGAPWWPLAKSQRGARRPRMIALSKCDRILIEKVKLENSPMFHIAISGHSTNVTVRGVAIHAPPSTDPVNPSHNTDACDVSGSHVLIEDCDVSVGDDDFTCGGETSDVHIRHCTYGYGHGLSIGSPTAGGVSDITVEDCTFTNTECGIRIKSDRDRGGEVHHLVYRNLLMKNVGMPILIYAAYMAPDKKYRDLNNLTGEIAAGYPSKTVAARTPMYHDITFSNITATVAPGQRAGLIWGLPEAPAADVVLRDVNITADKPFGVYFAKGVRLENCKITTPEGENKISTAEAEVSVSN
jgi:polygalacturonase